MAQHTLDTIQITPTWVQAMEVAIAVLEDGSEEGKTVIRAELRSLAKKVDAIGKAMAINAELLDALKDAVQDLQDWASDHEEPGEPFVQTEAILKASRAAIAKAEGGAP